LKTIDGEYLWLLIHSSCTPCHRFNACEQFHATNGFLEVIIGTFSQCRDDILLPVARGTKDNWHA